MTEIRQLAAVDEAALETFLQRVSDRDRTFFKEDVGDPDVRAAWRRHAGSRAVAGFTVGRSRPARTEARWVSTQARSEGSIFASRSTASSASASGCFSM